MFQNNHDLLDRRLIVICFVHGCCYLCQCKNVFCITFFCFLFFAIYFVCVFRTAWISTLFWVFVYVYGHMHSMYCLYQKCWTQFFFVCVVVFVYTQFRNPYIKIQTHKPNSVSGMSLIVSMPFNKP